MFYYYCKCVDNQFSIMEDPLLKVHRVHSVTVETLSRSNLTEMMCLNQVYIMNFFHNMK